MRKKIILSVLAALLACALSFLLGWRVMPKVWPTLKEAVVYPIFPALRPEPVPEPEPYVPDADASVGDALSETDSVIYYFYKPYCPYCEQLDPLMRALPDEITLPDGTVSRVKLIAVDKTDTEQAKLIDAYYDAHDVPEERRFVPAVVIGDRYLMSGSEIIEQLLDALAAGEGVHTERLG